MPTDSTTDSDCLFCRIVAGEVPSEKVLETGATYAFRDISPVAPTHVLVVPRSHHPDAASLAAAEPESLVELVRTAEQVAALDGLEEGYRLVFNTGAGAQQTVFHVHLHVIGGRAMTWPPG